MSELQRIQPCPKCGKEAVLKRSQDPSELNKRYSVGCDNERCSQKKTKYGMTANMAITEWNTYVSRYLYKIPAM